MPVSGMSPCAACKLLRRRCTKDCIFAPYFPPEEPHKFLGVHRVFGASNVNKMLQDLPVHQRGDAVSSMVYEANARIRDPVYGCVGAISSLQHQVAQLQRQLALAQAEIVCMRVHQTPVLATVVASKGQRQPASNVSPVLQPLSPEAHPHRPFLASIEALDLGEGIWTC